ncbi:helix-turn-helix domain-containing protein [Actinomycetospora termitidis]|uniref:Helix-turn-helix domain-containing protein n=1 Tax=Actinomycetospora termitidis TaxID=3053470 RepID=A0ABT7MGE9_9PSEU|nr:helix-turn-helix domain-containing protein [Actinomycetospora sp. Odt1-22]MDL5159758.1 helix-turn-helix domain-containing protein [Actinomycetospora sp. Odt1-22]
MRRSRRAWEAFQSGHEPVGVSGQVLTSWRRSRWSGVDPGRTEIPIVDVDTDSEFVRIASPVVLRAADSLTGGPACLALADAHGHVVWRWVSEPAIGRALDAQGMQHGSFFAEQRVGTNGIGTSLESRELATVFGPDHYVEAFHRWACVAAPVVHPVTGRVHGAVNVTCFAEDANQFLRALTRSLADTVSSRIAEHGSREERALLDAFVSGRVRTTAPVVAVTSSLMFTDDVAGAWGLEHRTVWELVRHAGPAADVVVRDGLRARVHPLVGIDGALLTLHPDPTSAAVPPTPESSPLEAAEADVIARTLAECRGNKSVAAATLGISRATLYQKLRRYRISWAPDTSRAL